MRDYPPLVSIIVPVLDGEQYLHESLDSILAQTYSHIEVLVMDDASSDGTGEIIGSYGDRIKYYRQSQNRGIYGNTNDGIAMASGEYIAVYHADDVYEPSIVEREVSYLEHWPEVGAVFCQDIFIDPEGREVGRLTLPPEVRGGCPLDYATILNALLKYKNVFLRCPSSMVRTSVYRELGGYRDQQFRNTSDLDMWLRIAQKYPIGILEEYLFRYRFGHGSSAQRYHHLRTDPGRQFLILDLYLDQGGRALARPDALAGYEAHRAEDHLMRAINHYVLDKSDEARAILGEVRAAQILASSQLQRARLLALFLLLQGLVRVPRISFIANLLYQRRYGRLKPARHAARSGFFLASTRKD